MSTASLALRIALIFVVAAFLLSLTGCVCLTVTKADGTRIQYRSTKDVHAESIRVGDVEIRQISTSGLRDMAGAISNVAQAVTIP